MGSGGKPKVSQPRGYEINFIVFCLAVDAPPEVPGSSVILSGGSTSTQPGTAVLGGASAGNALNTAGIGGTTKYIIANTPAQGRSNIVLQLSRWCTLRNVRALCPGWLSLSCLFLCFSLSHCFPLSPSSLSFSHKIRKEAGHSQRHCQHPSRNRHRDRAALCSLSFFLSLSLSLSLSRSHNFTKRAQRVYHQMCPFLWSRETPPRKTKMMDPSFLS